MPVKVPLYKPDSICLQMTDLAVLILKKKKKPQTNLTKIKPSKKKTKN